MARKSAFEKRLLQQFETVELETAKKWRKLRASPAFLVETEKLTLALEDALSSHAGDVKLFFDLFGYPIGKSVDIRNFLSTLSDQLTREALQAYPTYVARFGVRLKLRRKPPHFKPYPLMPMGSTFHVKIKKGKLIPFVPHRPSDGPYIYLFETSLNDAPPYVQPLINEGVGKFVQVDDEDNSSMLTRFETFAYESDSITFIVHHLERDSLFCLIGENVTTETWRKAGAVVTAFQKQLSKKGKAGRPADIKRLKKTHLLLRNKGLPKKNVAAEVSKGSSDKEHFSARSYVSIASKQLR